MSRSQKLFVWISAAEDITWGCDGLRFKKGILRVGIPPSRSALAAKPSGKAGAFESD